VVEEEVFLVRMELLLPNWRMKTIICMSYYLQMTINWWTDDVSWGIRTFTLGHSPWTFPPVYQLYRLRGWYIGIIKGLH